jgi:hypothetical protein
MPVDGEIFPILFPEVPLMLKDILNHKLPSGPAITPLRLAFSAPGTGYSVTSPFDGDILPI